MSEGKKELSKTVKGMKFMQRGDEAALRKKLEAEREKEMADSMWVTRAATSDSSSGYVVAEEEPSAAAPATAAPAATASVFRSGRRSYGAFNPVVDKIVAEVKRETTHAVAEQRDAISDDQLANRYQKYVAGGAATAAAGSKKTKATAAAAVSVDSDSDDGDAVGAGAGDDEPAITKRQKLDTAASATASTGAAAAASKSKKSKHSAAASAPAKSKSNKSAGAQQPVSAKGFIKPRDPLQ